MVVLGNFKGYVAEKRVFFYDEQGRISHTCQAVLPKCPEDVLSRMKKICEDWKWEGHTTPYFLFPGDEGYPAELLEKR